MEKRRNKQENVRVKSQDNNEVSTPTDHHCTVTLVSDWGPAREHMPRCLSLTHSLSVRVAQRLRGPGLWTFG